MTWLSTSIMARKGVAKGIEGAHHKITIEDQGTFHYVYGPWRSIQACASASVLNARSWFR
ncbi:hypothetical protein [Roseovarius sp. Pro17]|uniref:hypothetical protein n=1 Tax=Roseovarius sp. Pro17 TaxID=3108175 RepID=UPI002D7738FD|nr:hypothetical protein [Roseovarius sp. Pro17]